MNVVFTVTPGLAFSNAFTAASAGPWPAAARVSTCPDGAAASPPPEVEQAAAAMARQHTGANVLIDFMRVSEIQGAGERRAASL
ncbi:hypothetical protein GCM10009734_82890 [Nonomuraea bangladeshensis]